MVVPSIAAAQEHITIITEPAPLAWGVVAFLALLLIMLVGIILTIVKKSIGEEVKLQKNLKTAIEDSYARKIRSEYQAKHEVLDKKLDQVRQRFSMVMMKVKTLLDTLDPEELFKAICELVENEIGADRYILFLVDPIKNELYPFRWHGYANQIEKILLMPVNHVHFLTHALKRRQTTFRDSAVSDVEIRKLIDRKPDTNTLVAIPLFSRDKAYGVVHVESFADGHTEMDQSEIRFLSALPTFIGGALANADIFMQTREELTSTKKITEQEIAEKRRLHEIFSRYTSAELVENLIKNPEKIDLGGVSKTATILFSDIAGFTAFSAKFSPKEVVSLMNEYLSRMTEIVLNHQGEIDKFIGDAIMARFGVLSELENSSQNAVEAACHMLEELDKLRNEWAARGLENFNIRIGVATGPVLAGNIGSTRRQEFTVMGTTVNLASRLEALNKELGSRILIDEETFNNLPRNFKFNRREGQRIRGLDGTINVYEILELSKGPKVISLQAKLDQNQQNKPALPSEQPQPGISKQP